jgi:phosphoglycolate phosphatase-like HAD superfamily hydrolase
MSQQISDDLTRELYKQLLLSFCPLNLAQEFCTWLTLTRNIDEGHWGKFIQLTEVDILLRHHKEYSIGIYTAKSSSETKEISQNHNLEPAFLRIDRFSVLGRILGWPQVFCPGIYIHCSPTP